MSKRLDMVSDAELEKAARLFKSFHDKPPVKGKILQLKMAMPEAALEVGQFFGIIYIADGQKYLHKFNPNNRPLVTVSADGKQIYILKGGYRFTYRGFIG